MLPATYLKMKTLNTPAKVFLACLSIAVCSGCANQKTWVYRPESYTPVAHGTGKTIAVVAYEDERENKNSNLIGLYALPLMPFGWQELNSPEGIQQHMNSGMGINYKPTEDYPKALSEDLKKTGLFSDAFFDYRKSTSDYAVKGKILSTKYVGRLWSYGLSVEGPLLWFIGLPSVTINNEVELDLSLVNSKTDKVLFSKVYTANRSNVSFLYYIADDFDYPEMVAEVNKQFCTDIQPIILKAVVKEPEPEAP